MSESPDRKMIKDMLGKLKEASINSRRSVIERAIKVIDVFTQLEQSYRALEDVILKDSDTSFAKMSGDFKVLMTMVENSFHEVLLDLVHFMENDILYISHLEQYSAENDKTLKVIFDRLKEAEEKAESELEILRKKSPTYIS